VALPLDDINVTAAREKSIRHDLLAAARGVMISKAMTRYASIVVR